MAKFFFVARAILVSVAFVAGVIGIVLCSQQGDWLRVAELVAFDFLIFNFFAFTKGTVSEKIECATELGYLLILLIGGWTLIGFGVSLLLPAYIGIEGMLLLGFALFALTGILVVIDWKHIFSRKLIA